MIHVKHEPEHLGEPYENCCFCNTPTPYWFELRDVACCQACAKSAEEDMVPFKDEWVERQRFREQRLVHLSRPKVPRTLQ